MWHIFGPLVRWPLHSPLRLVGVIAAVIAAVMVLGVVNDRGAAPISMATSTPTDEPRVASEPESWPVRVPTPVPLPAESSREADADPATAGGTDAFSEDLVADSAMLAAQQAAEFVAAWARPDLDAPTWQAGLAPHATPELLASLADTEPANVPAVTVSGQPVEVAANAEAAVFDVPTTGDFVRVHVQLVDGTWLATDVQPIP